MYQTLNSTSTAKLLNSKPGDFYPWYLQNPGEYDQFTPYDRVYAAQCFTFSVLKELARGTDAFNDVSRVDMGIAPKGLRFEFRAMPRFRSQETQEVRKIVARAVRSIRKAQRKVAA